MDIMLEAASTERHFEQILDLQRQNLLGARSEAEQMREGFVFAVHTMDLLKKMAAQLPQVIALCNDQVVGYTLAMPVSMRYEMPSLVPMFEAFEQCTYREKPLTTYRFMVGGQVCVARAFRGQGLLRRLYEEARNRLPSGYQLCVTEVAERNPVSLRAHQKMGFEVVGTYHDGKEQWHVVVWEMEKATTGS